jgi:hypothetical protein
MKTASKFRKQFERIDWIGSTVLFVNRNNEHTN